MDSEWRALSPRARKNLTHLLRCLQAWDGVNQCEGSLRIVTIGSGQLNGERNPATVAYQMTLAAQLGPVSRIRPRLRPPKTARIELPSTTARDQSLCP